MVLDTDSAGMDSRSDIAVAVHTLAVVVDIAVVVRTAAVEACHTVVAVGKPVDHKELQVELHGHKARYLAADHKAWHLAPFAVVAAVHKRASPDTADFEHRNSPELRVQLRDALAAVVD